MEELENQVVDDVEDAATEETAEAQGNNQDEPEKKYTDKDVDRIIAKKIAAERKRMSKLFNEEQHESEIEKRERNVILRELKADAKDTLIERGLPSTLAEFLDYSGKEELKNSINSIEKTFSDAVMLGVKAKLRGSVPTVGSFRAPSKDEEQPLRNAFSPASR